LEAGRIVAGRFVAGRFVEGRFVGVSLMERGIEQGLAVMQGSLGVAATYVQLVLFDRRSSEKSSRT
jgi:hypothetical protein